MNNEQLKTKLTNLKACRDSTVWLESVGPLNLEEVWSICERGDWMLWIAARLEIDRKLLVSATCLCARQSLVHVRPGEERPRIAIETAERWMSGESTIEEVRAARDAAYSAANAAAYSAASTSASIAADAAYSAAYAAAYAAARRKSLAESARLVRTVIGWDVLEAKIDEVNP